MERKILQVSLKDRIKNTHIRSRKDIVDAATHARRLTWKWCGPVMRMDSERRTYITTEWDPMEVWRYPGRQHTRWHDTFKKKCGNTWARAAKGREIWRKLLA